MDLSNSNWTGVMRPCAFVETLQPENANGSSSLLVQFGQNFGELHGPLSLAVCLFGISTNLANILVLTRSSMSHSATNHLMVWLAVSDLITMLFCVPLLYHFYIVRPNPAGSPMYSPSKLWVIYKTVAVSGLIIFHSLAMWIAVVLAVFRYLYIGFPTIGPRLATKRRAFYSVIILAIGCVIFVIPNTMINFIDQCYGPKWTVSENPKHGNQTFAPDHYVVYYSVGYEAPVENNDSNTAVWRKEELYAINTWLQASLFKIVPCVLLSILTVLLVFQMKRAVRRRRNLQQTEARKQMKQLLRNTSKDERGQHNSENRTTTLLLAILITVLIVELPQGILVICLQLIDNFFVDYYQHLGDFIDFTTLLNEATNFVIYTSMSQQFRQEFCHVFGIDRLRNHFGRSKRSSSSVDNKLLTGVNTDMTNAKSGV